MKTKSKILSILLVLAMVLSIIPATVFAAESTSTMIDRVENLKPGTYYMGGYLESYTYTQNKETITKDYSNGPYHMWTGATKTDKNKTDLVTSQYSYHDETLTKVGSSEAKAVQLVAVEGKANTYKVMVDNKYLYSKSASTRALALTDSLEADTVIEWVASNHKDGGIVLTSNGVDLGTAGATSNLMRAYVKYSDKDTGELKMNSSVKYGLVFFPATSSDNNGTGDGNQGGTGTTPAFESKLNKAESAEVHNAYKLGVGQMTLEKDLYFKGTFQSDKYMETTENADEAVDIYLENAESGVYIYFMNESAKTYLCVYSYANGSKTSYGVKGVTDATNASVFGWNDTYKVLTTKVGDVEYYLGCYNEFSTFSPSKISFITTSYPAYLCKAAHTHDFTGDWQYDASEHWKECVCGEKSVEEHDYVTKVTEDKKGCYDECQKCGCKTSGDEHSVSNWTTIREATADETGLETGNCINCGTKVEKIIPKIHKCEAAEGWKFDENNHWHECTGEGCEEKLNKAEHTWVEDKDQYEAPSCTEKGKKTYKCECGATKTEEIAAVGHKLTKVEKVEATTEKEGCKEHYKCECGKLFTDAEGKNETTADKLVIAKLTNTENKNENTIILVINGKYVTGTEYLYKYTNKQGNELQKYELVVSENKADALELIRVDNADGTVTFKTKDGKFLYADGTNVQLKDAEGEHTKFVLETTEGGYFLKCANATYNNNAQYLEVYNGYLTCYGKYDNSDATIYTFKLEAVKAAEDDKKDDTSDKKDDTTVKPSKTELKPISKAPVAETGYKYGMYNKKLGKTLYITGEMSGYYLATTTDASKAANVYLETVEGGYKLYFKNADGKKQYIEIYSYEYESNGEKKTGVGVQIVDEATNIYTWNAELKVLVSNVNGEDYYLGTYYNASKDTTYETMSASKLTYISGDNASKIGDTQYPAYLYEEVNVSTGDDTNLMAIVAMMVVAMAGMAVVVINRKRETV